MGGLSVSNAIASTSGHVRCLAAKKSLLRRLLVIFALGRTVPKKNRSEREQGHKNLKLKLSKHSNHSRVVCWKRISEEPQRIWLPESNFVGKSPNYVVLVSTCRLSFFWHVTVSRSTRWINPRFWEFLGHHSSIMITWYKETLLTKIYYCTTLPNRHLMIFPRLCFVGRTWLTRRLKAPRQKERISKRICPLCWLRPAGGLVRLLLNRSNEIKYSKRMNIPQLKVCHFELRGIVSKLRVPVTRAALGDIWIKCLHWKQPREMNARKILWRYM